jgi:RimJ/RimL family protein N-acetyltransferase
LVETRSMLLSGDGRVHGDTEGGRYLVWEDDLAAVVGLPDPDGMRAAVAAAPGVATLLAMRDAFEPVRRALPAWRFEEAVIHALPDPAPEWPLPGEHVRFLDADAPLLHLERALATEIAAALGWAPVAAAWCDDRPVAFCYASSVTETLWDVSIDTALAYRRRGFAQGAVSLMGAFHRENAQLPVWGALVSNLPSMHLAERLGFAPVDTLYVFSRRD